MAQKDTCMSVEEARQLIMDPRYIIDEFVGAGAMACVYKARERSTPNIYALKVLREEFYQRKGFVEIFEKEATHMRDLQYPNMVRFYKFVNEEHIAYILMDYVEGKPLTKYIQEARKSGDMIPLSIIVRMMAQIARAINYLHDEGYIHRDIKPGNILLAGENHSAFLTDLGIAGAFDAQETLGGAGTPSYMPYEQQIGTNVDHTVDIYAFAIMLFEVFTGRKPFLPAKGLTVKEAREAMRELHQSGELPSLVELRPELPEEIDEIFRQALAKDPNQRYQDVMDFAQDIHELLKSSLPDDLRNFADIRPQEIKRAEESSKTSVSQEMVVVHAPRNTRLILFGGAMTLILIVLVVIWGIWLNTQASIANVTSIETAKSTIELSQIASAESVQSTEEPTLTATITPSLTPTATPFLFGEEITIALEGSDAIGLDDDLDSSLRYAVLLGGNYVPLRLNAVDAYHLEFVLAQESLENYNSYGIVFAYQSPENYLSLRIDVENQEWLLEDWQAGVSTLLNRGDIEAELPNSLSFSKRETYLRFELDGQVFQQELDEHREGLLGLWLEAEDITMIQMTQLEVGLVGAVETIDDFISPKPEALEYVLQDIEALLETGDVAKFEVQCPEFIDIYNKLGLYLEESWRDFAADATNLAQEAQDLSLLIHSACNGQDEAVSFAFADYQEWENGLKGLLMSNTSQ